LESDVIWPEKVKDEANTDRLTDVLITILPTAPAGEVIMSVAYNN